MPGPCGGMIQTEAVGQAPQTAAAAAGAGRGRSSVRAPRRRGSFPGSGDMSPVLEFKDDNQGISSSFRILGMVHESGPKRAMGKAFRCSLIASCDHVCFPMVRLCQLEEDEVDELLYVLTRSF